MTASTLDPLTVLAIRHGTDKFGGHHYTPIYDAILRPLRNEPIRLLEIGIGGYRVPDAGGSSLRMWADYFPEALIVGLDVERKTFATSPRIKLLQGSQSDPKRLREIAAEFGPFDVVIDDGSHHVDHVASSFLTLYDTLNPTGFYIVEDTQTAFREAFGGGCDGAGTIFDLARDLALAMHRLEGFEGKTLVPVALGDITSSVTFHRNMVIFARGRNRYPSNLSFEFENEDVRLTYDAISIEAARHFDPRSVLSRIDMNILGRRIERAVALALEAAHAHPANRELLIELERMMRRAQCDHVVKNLRRRINSL